MTAWTKGGLRMPTVYLDSVFFLNGLMDYLLLLVAARIAGIPLCRRRYVLGALVGAVYAVGVFLPGLHWLGEPPVKAAVLVVMAVAAYGRQQRMLRLTLLFAAVSCAMAGCVLTLSLVAGSRVPVQQGIFYTDVDGTVLLTAAAAAYFLTRLLLRGILRHGVEGTRFPVRLCVSGRVTTCTALHDTGNGLRDPLDDRPVLVLSPSVAKSALPREVEELLTPEALAAPDELLQSILKKAPALAPRLLPYRSVGKERGLMLTLRSDWMEVGGRSYTGQRFALSPTEVGTDYSALWGGAVREERVRGANFKLVSEHPAKSRDSSL